MLRPDIAHKGDPGEKSQHCDLQVEVMGESP